MTPQFDVTPGWRASQLAFFQRQFFRSPPTWTRNDADLSGKTAIVTGSNTGLGFECSRQLLDLGLDRLILAVRSEAKGEEAKKTLLAGQKSSSVPIIEVWKLDLSSYDSIVAFAERAKSLERLDIAIHNAGLLKNTFEANNLTGHEETIQVNYLALALFTLLLLPVMKEKSVSGQPGHLALVSSDTAAWTSFKKRNSESLFASLDEPESYDGGDQYSTSKLLGAESHGQYLEDGKVQPMAPLVYEPEGEKIAEKVWRETMNELAFANVADLVSSLSR
ncbi:hypothetical protein TrVFT333_005997 [Trichoderma virens FT-333]|nr:hypothetical protein TrVFT333_005997 [Trichoderma virens FT-333]